MKNVMLIGYDKVDRNNTDKLVHFFLDDYKFEALWNDPAPKIDRLKPYAAVLSPQYSLYTEMPFSLKAHNIFKSRWCGAYKQSKGLKVIPSLVWGNPETFWFCFDGIEKGSIVAVSTVGQRKEKDLFMRGYSELLRRIRPEKIICYGEPFEEMKGSIIHVDYAVTNNLIKGYRKVTGQCLKPIYETSEPVYLFKGGGAAGGTGNASSSIPKFPGWNPNASPAPGFEWRGRGEPGSKQGNWYNPDTGEWFRPDLDHLDPIGPHWDYFDGTNGFRIFPDGTYSPKAFESKECVIK